MALTKTNRKAYLIGTLILVLALVLFFFLWQKSSATTELPVDRINASSEKFKELIRPTYFNIEDFGGDMQSNDNSAALQAAIDAAIITATDLRDDDKWDIYKGKVYIPRGTGGSKKGSLRKQGWRFLGMVSARLTCPIREMGSSWILAPRTKNSILRSRTCSLNKPTRRP